jgi:flagellum-specific peptidoglycan hydrolase FlgJ
MTTLINIIRDHWFKIALATILALFLLKKEFSFQFNMRDKKAQEKQETKTGKYTEVTNAQIEEDKLSLFNLVDLLPSGHNLREDFDATAKAEKIAFVKRFGKVARDEQAKFNIPASLILAEAMLQSSVGKRDLAATHQNFFALPCGKYWKGETVSEGTICFRHYGSAWESFRDHSVFISKSLDAPKTRDYKPWVAAMSEAFGTKDEYAQLLIEIIEKYDLYLLDK